MNNCIKFPDLPNRLQRKYEKGYAKMKALANSSWVDLETQGTGRSINKTVGYVQQYSQVSHGSANVLK